MGSRRRPLRPVPELVELLADLLAEAQSGNLRALWGVAEGPNERLEYLSAGELVDVWAAASMLDDLSREVTEELP